MERRVAGKVGSQGERVQKITDQTFCLESISPPKRRADDDFPLIIVHDGRGLVELGWVYRDGLRFVAIVIGRELARYDTIDAATAAIFAATRKGRARTEEGAAD